MKKELLMQKAFIVSFLLLSATFIYAQKYEIDASDVMISPLENIYTFDHTGPKGKEIIVNSLYMTIGGKAVFPVMGEIQFSRLVREQWEETILKMKACGINIVATYLFWNHHEEIEGQFKWDDNRDIRAFTELCAKHGLFVYPRIGPYAHGEARNGGIPDWILKKKFLINRSNDPVYQSYVKRYFTEIVNQLRGLTYQEGGPIIGIQLENEYKHKEEGEAHIMWLKNLINDLGFNVPMYSVTAWAGGSAPPREVIPIWGAYADAPWNKNIRREVDANYFRFNGMRANVAANLMGTYKEQEEYTNYNLHPYFNAELGAGIQETYHRRLVIDPILALCIPTIKVGEGASLLGYYVFGGGTHPRGELQSNADLWESGGSQNVPIKNYDFQAPIRSSGEITEGYRKLKCLHYFLNEFGEELAPMCPTNNQNPYEGLQLAVRSNNHYGVLVGINYCRYIPKKVVEKPQFRIKLKDETIIFPQQDIFIPDSTVFIWPLNFNIGGLNIKYTTAQLMSVIGDYCFLYQNKDIGVEIAFEDSALENIKTTNGKVLKKNNALIVNGLQPGIDCIINIKMKNGASKKVVVLTEKDAENSWIFEKDGNKELYITSGYMYNDGKDNFVFSNTNKITVLRFDKSNHNTPFVKLNVSAPEVSINIKPAQHSILADAQWLETGNFSIIKEDEVLFHRNFIKEFSLENPSSFRKATLYLYPETDCVVKINDIHLNQRIVPGSLNVLDITGYVKNGGNMMFISFPFTLGQHKMAARIIVEYSNYDRIEFSSDQSWLTKDMFKFPSLFRMPNNPVPPIITSIPAFVNDLSAVDFKEWDIEVPANSLDGLSSLYFHLKYVGDRTELYNGHILVSDDYNNNTHWSVNLKRLEYPAKGRTLRMVIYPLTNDGRKFFDIPPKQDEYNVAGIKNFEVIPEYKVRLE